MLVINSQWVIISYGIKKEKWQWRDLNHLVDFVITAVAIIAMAIPEVSFSSFYLFICPGPPTSRYSCISLLDGSND